MKKLSFLTLTLSLIFAASQVYALSMAPYSGEVDQLVAMAGKNATIIDGQATKIEDGALPNGWQIKIITMVGTVLKGSQDCPLAEGEVTCTFKMISPLVIPYLEIPELNKPGIYTFYGSGKYGTTSMAFNGRGTIAFTGPPDNQSAPARYFRFKNPQNEAKLMQSNPGLRKYLAQPKGATGATPSIAGGNSVSRNDARAIMKGLVNQYYPTGN